MIDFSAATVWSGNTYSIREELKAAGGVWDDITKTWLVPTVSGQAEIVTITRLWLKPGVEVTVA